MKERLQMGILIFLAIAVIWFSGFMSYSAAMNPTVEEIYGFYKIKNKTIFGTEHWYVENGELEELERFLKENDEYEIPVQRSTETRWDIQEDAE